MKQYFSTLKDAAGNLYYGRRYTLDPDKWTLYDMVSKEPVRNAYKEEVERFTRTRVYLSGVGGKNPRKRKFLGWVQYAQRRNGNRLLDPVEFSVGKHALVKDECEPHWRSIHVSPARGWNYTRETFCSSATYSALIVRNENDFKTLVSIYPDRYPPVEVPDAVSAGEAKIRSLIQPIFSL